MQLFAQTDINHLFRWLPSFVNATAPDTFEASFYRQIMSAIFILLGTSLLVAVGFLVAFISATRKGQFEDDYTPSVRMLFENEVQSPQAEPKKTSKKL